MAALPTELSGIWWTGFSLFEIGWIFLAVLAVILAFAGYGIRERWSEKNRKLVSEKRGSAFGTRGSIVVFVTFVVLTMAAGFMYLSFVQRNTLPFIFRDGEDVIPGGCTEDLANNGTCGLLLRPMWYVILFTIYATMFSLVFGFTALTSAMFLFGSITLSFGLNIATYTGDDAAEWAAWALSVVGAIWAIGWSTYAFFDINSAAIFVTVIDLESPVVGGLSRPDLPKGPKVPEWKRIPQSVRERLPGFPESKKYWQFMNPFMGDGVYFIFWIVNSLFYLWYSFEWLVGPLAPISGGYGIVDEAGIMLASDVLLFFVVPFAMLAVWFFYDPGTWRMMWKVDLRMRRAENWNLINPGSASTAENFDHVDPRGSIRKVQDKKSSTSKGKRTALVLN